MRARPAATIGRADRVLVLEKAFAVLDLLGGEDDGLRLAEIQRTLSIPRPTIHRILTALLEHGYVNRTDDDHYHLGLRLYELGMRVYKVISAIDTIAGELEAIADDLDATTYLSVKRVDMAMCLARVDRGVLRIADYHVGETLPLTVGGGPKVLLAGMCDEDISALLDAGALPIFTANTLSTRHAVLETVRQIRRDGYAIGHGDHVAIQTAIGVPLYDGTGMLAGAISVAMFQPRPMRGERELIIERLQAGAARLARQHWHANELSR